MRAASAGWGAISAGLLLVGPTLARAAGDPIAAESLFEDGRALMAKRDYAEACGKFEASQRLDPALGTQLNLANCFEKLGKTASAWFQFREAASAARRQGDASRQKVAERRAAALKVRLSRLLIVVRGAGGSPADVRVERNGGLVHPAAWGSPIPVDPGRQHLVVSAPGREPWEGDFEVSGEGSVVRVEVPPLGELATPSPLAEAAPVDSPLSSGWFWTGAVVGAAGLATGTALGLQARSTWDEATSKCRVQGRSACEAGASELERDASSQANWATVALAAGAAGAVGALTYWWVAGGGGSAEAGEPRSPKLQIALGPAGGSLRGEF